MNKKTGFNASALIEELDSAVMRGDTEKADEISEILFKLQGGQEEDAVMPPRFPGIVSDQNKDISGEHKVKPNSIKRIVSIAAAAVLVMTLSITAIAANLFGLRDMVFDNGNKDAVPNWQVSAPVTDEAALHNGIPDAPDSDLDLIAMQGYPDSSEYKASAEWNVFCQNYDTDHAILNQVGNSSNEYTEKYPLYLVYSKEMADKLEEIIAKYKLSLHTAIALPENPEAFFSTAGTGDFLESQSSQGVNRNLGGYVYNDGTFQFDGEAVLSNSAVIGYQFANYVKGTFSDTYLNIGDSDAYQEWPYETASGVQVSLALSETKALIITDLGSSFVTVNVLAGTGDSGFGSSSITRDDLQRLADMFDFTQIS